VSLVQHLEVEIAVARFWLGGIR